MIPQRLKMRAFQFYFSDASFVGWMVFMLQCGLVMAQHLSLALSTHWYQLISEVSYVTDVHIRHIFLSLIFFLLITHIIVYKGWPIRDD